MKSRKIFGCFIFGLVILCMGAFPAFAAKDSITYAIDSKFASMERYSSTQTFANNLWMMIGDGVVRRNHKTLEHEPALAESWKQIDDVTWEFKLRKGVKFHNGNELTSEAIRYTIMDLVLSPEYKNPSKGYLKWIKEIKILDKYTFQIISDGPYPMVLDRMCWFTPYDPAYVKEKGLTYIQEHPVGTGPYRFVKWERGSRLEIVKNKDHWEPNVGHVEKIIFRIIPELSTRVAELRSGGVDLIVNVDPDKVGQVEVDKKLKVISGPIARTIFYQFDSFGRASKTPVMDKRVRQAIWHAIDREGIVKNLLNGYGKVTNAACNPYLFGYVDDIKGYPYDPEKAKALLKEAGYEKGFDLDIWQYYQVQNLFNQAAMDMLSQVGIKVKLHDYRGNIGQLLKVRNTGKVTGIGNFGWGTSFAFDADAILPAWFFKSESKCYAPDDKIDAWLHEARVSTDKKRRLELYRMAQQRIVDEVYWMPLFYKYQINGAHKDLDVKVMPYEYVLLQYAKWLK
jgi:peptide/nickel transport system substrate-binding protein